MFELKFLGTADSAGIPVHNCQCDICTEYRKKEKVNLSTSAYIELNNQQIILLDAGIENIATLFDGKKIEAIFMTHFHPDHALGLLRLRYSNDIINCYHPKDDLGFADLFKHTKSINYQVNIPFEKIMINQISFTPIPLKHSKNTTGYLIEDGEKTIAYLTDCAKISQESMNFLLSKKIDECYIDGSALPTSSNSNHLSYEEATEILDKLNAKKSYIIHLGHKVLDYIKQNGITLKYQIVNGIY
ncbi:MBL fold metallo-hydrolase [Arcobacter sp. FWKO B]|uniref:MBL fold metallo-hydrolase n=1 Tax=Arcobacter sp. FWKO B TaxID=2593672 RepID=UPI0018A45223|nr:MBL fold metallo-hydrolase [Arcobacter sp. FWKO B]QOG12352.1 MBL fold metallo-hydrolase [Arcobacter sp. FWKO B]